jgi:uncharacterized integral membrane protein
MIKLLAGLLVFAARNERETVHRAWLHERSSVAKRGLNHLAAAIVGVVYVTVFAQSPDSSPPLAVVFLGSFVVTATIGFVLGRRARSHEFDGFQMPPTGRDGRITSVLAA